MRSTDIEKGIFMKIFICLDDDNGMMFNNRRQSRDGKVVEDVIKTVGGNILFTDEYSKNLFKDFENVIVADEFQDDGFFFVENRDIEEFCEKISVLTVYRWNRKYPNDFALSFNIKDKGFKLFETSEFEGNSHEKITKEVWVK